LRKEENIPITSITFWGTDDGNSWLNSSNSVGGSADGSRPQCPLLFDAAFQSKPAFWAFVDTQDSIEVFIDEANSKTEAYGDVHKQYRVNYENEHSFNGPKCVDDNITSVVTKTDKGYIVEMAVLWTEIEPQDGTYIGFELQINDCKDGSRLGMLNWYDSTNTCWSTPASFGTARLIQND